LVSSAGDDAEGRDPPLAKTRWLNASPYLEQVLRSFGTVLGACRLMCLDAGARVPAHSDIRYYWRKRTRIHVPIITSPKVRFFCGDAVVHMAAGESWIFDNWQRHSVVNDSENKRIHLVVDTVGTAAFWRLALEGERNNNGSESTLLLESRSPPQIMYSAELEMDSKELMADADALSSNARDGLCAYRSVMETLLREWRVLDFTPADPKSRALIAMDLIQQARTAIEQIPESCYLSSNNMRLSEALESLFEAAVHPIVRRALTQKYSATRGNSTPSKLDRPRLFDRPVIIVSAPRSGSTLLFESLAQHQDLWTLGGESHRHLETIRQLRIDSRGYSSNRLLAEDLDGNIAAQLLTNFGESLRNTGGSLWCKSVSPPAKVRFLEKTPKNALRIPFFNALFPDALFIFLIRDLPANASSIIEAWRSGRFVTYPKLPGWHGDLPWSLALIPGWQNLNNSSIGEIAVTQWKVINETIIQDLNNIDPARWIAVSYDQLVADPAHTLSSICRFAGLPDSVGFGDIKAGELPASRYTLTPPSPEKWRINEKYLVDFLPLARNLEVQLDRALSERGLRA